MPWIVLAFALVPALAVAAAPAHEGRWQGVVDVPGRPLRVTLDLAADAAGRWSGSMIIPALGIAGAPLKDIVVDAERITFALTGTLDSARVGATTVDARLDRRLTLAGKLTQAGNAATLSLTRTGLAQVQAAPRSTPIRPALQGEWTGRYEMGGYPRDVTIALENTADRGAKATFVIVGKQRTVIPVDLVVEDGAFLRIESHEFGVTYEGRIGADASDISGTVTLGATEVPLVIRRASIGKR